MEVAVTVQLAVVGRVVVAVTVQLVVVGRVVVAVTVQLAVVGRVVVCCVAMAGLLVSMSVQFASWLSSSRLMTGCGTLVVDKVLCLKANEESVLCRLSKGMDLLRFEEEVMEGNNTLLGCVKSGGLHSGSLFIPGVELDRGLKKLKRVGGGVRADFRALGFTGISSWCWKVLSC